MPFDIGAVPFSRAGAYLAISHRDGQAPLGAGVYLRTLHGDAARDIVCRLDLRSDDTSTVCNVEAAPDALTLRNGSHLLHCIFSDTQTVRCSGNATIQLTFPLGLYDHAVPRNDGWQINSYSNRRSYALTASAGQWRVVTAAKAACIVATCAPDTNGDLDLCIVQFQSDWPVAPGRLQQSFGAARQAVATEFAQWLAQFPATRPAHVHAREMAAYVLWSCRVEPQGHLRREAILMSKNWMTSVWSWDHCFVAMALARIDPELAWDQLMLPFDVQGASGRLPDCLNDTALVWNFCKPPMHGWTLRWMVQHGFALDSVRMRAIYEPLCRWTLWWLRERDDRHDGLAQYNHGNDSGWDNATLFDGGVPLATPDLSAFLVVQMQVLAELAQKLDRIDDAQQWRERAHALRERLLSEFWHGDRFVARRTSDGCPVCSDSLLLLMPLILGASLPANVRDALLAVLQRFITPHGLATEIPASPYYEADSYWRGPVWAPVMFLIIESLREIGAHDLAAHDLAEKLRSDFCDTVAANGMAENFDALTGRGLRDPAHVWTAAVFTLLAASNFDQSGHPTPTLNY